MAEPPWSPPCSPVACWKGPQRWDWLGLAARLERRLAQRGGGGACVTPSYRLTAGRRQDCLDPRIWVGL